MFCEINKIFSFLFLLFILNENFALAKDYSFLDTREVRHIKIPTHFSSSGRIFEIHAKTISWTMERYFAQTKPSLKNIYSAAKTKDNPKLLLDGCYLLLWSVQDDKKYIKGDLERFIKIIHKEQEEVHNHHPTKKPLGGFAFVDNIFIEKNRYNGGKIPTVLILKFAETYTDMKNLIAAIPGGKGDATSKSLKKFNKSHRRKPFEHSLEHIKSGKAARNLFEEGLVKLVKELPKEEIHCKNICESEDFHERCTYTHEFTEIQKKYDDNQKLKVTIHICPYCGYYKFKDLMEKKLIEFQDKWQFNLIFKKGLYYNIKKNLKLLTSALGKNIPIRTLRINGPWSKQYPDGVMVNALGMQHLANALLTTTSLKKLMLRHQLFDPMGIHSFSEALKTNTSLKVLDLPCNKLEDNAARYLGNMLTINTSLKELDLFWNTITDTGIHSIAEGIKNNNTIKVLGLGYNKFTDVGAHLLIDALKVNTSIKWLDFRGNSISQNTKQELREIAYFKGIKICLKFYELWGKIKY